ncbi:MAG: hypothetical protein ACJ8FU_08785 [Xanthobacteraceae bacterium]|jgi:hypothetical protein
MAALFLFHFLRICPERGARGNHPVEDIRRRRGLSIDGGKTPKAAGAKRQSMRGNRVAASRPREQVCSHGHFSSSAMTFFFEG